MKTIEERAADKYCIRCGARTIYGCTPDKSPCTYVKDYIKIATEQRAIDDKEKEELINLASKRIADVEASRSRLLQRRERIVEEAWQWMVDWVFENAPHEVFDELMSSREDYIKAMEESAMTDEEYLNSKR